MEDSKGKHTADRGALSSSAPGALPQLCISLERFYRATRHIFYPLQCWRTVTSVTALSLDSDEKKQCDDEVARSIAVCTARKTQDRRNTNRTIIVVDEYFFSRFSNANNRRDSCTARFSSCFKPSCSTAQSKVVAGSALDSSGSVANFGCATTLSPFLKTRPLLSMDAWTVPRPQPFVFVCAILYPSAGEEFL